MSTELRSNAPTGPIETAWQRHKFDIKVVNPANKRKYTVIVVGTGLAGASAAATRRSRAGPRRSGAFRFLDARRGGSFRVRLDGLP